jgi:hypothetical protein
VGSEALPAIRPDDKQTEASQRLVWDFGRRDEVRHHLLIAGTGRAGTSFLVRLLHEIGLDTHLGRRGEGAFWDDNANAGFEDHVLWKTGDLPYVAKFPWLFETIDAVLADPDVVIDAVIVPVRDLDDAAASRVVLELRNRHAMVPQMQDEQRVWEHWGATPGGVIYSLNPLDEARLLAVGFHRLIERLVAAEIPVHMLAFPRMIEDAEHVLRQLRGCIAPEVTDEQVRAAHSRVADLAKVRVGREPAGNETAAANPGPMGDLDRQALAREVTRLRAELTGERASSPIGRKNASPTLPVGPDQGALGSRFR